MQLSEGSSVLSRFYDTCKQNNLRVTPQRKAIYEEILKSTNHPTAEMVHSVLKSDYPSISLDTVHRALLTFVRIGLISMIEGYGTPRRFDSMLENHHHAHCEKCGKIIDFKCESYEDLEIPGEISRKFTITTARVVLKGLCRECQNDNNVN